MPTARFSLTPVTGDSFIGRKKLIREMTEELVDPKSHIGFCLYGRRRTGKTSTLMELRYLLRRRKDIIVVYLSLYDFIGLSVRTFGEELTHAILEAYQEKNLLPTNIKIRKLLETSIDIVMELLKNAKIEAAITEQIRLILEYQKAPQNYSEYMRQVFNMGEMLAKATQTKCVLIIDEFPEILKIENGIQLVKMLRTQYETQKRTALIISGSLRKTLEMVALSESSPFYKQLVPKHLVPFDESETRDFLETYLGTIHANTLKRLQALTDGLPFYLQFIGRSTHYEGDISSAVANFIQEEGNILFKEEFGKLSDKEKLIAISMSTGKKTLTEIARGCGEPTTAVGRYLPILIEKEVVTKETRGVYRLIDTLFGYWIKRNHTDEKES